MNDVDDKLRAELDRLVPSDSRLDWGEIAARSGLKRERARRRLVIGAAVAIATVVIGVASPLGAAIGRGLDDFSAWLTGEPGTPASESEQRAFESANARTWLRFPDGTRLRHLVTVKAGGETVELLGFRSGSDALCLRLSIRGNLQGRTMSCAPVAELRRSGGPARVVIADFALGKGDKQAWYGIDRYHSAKLQITAGIAADGVESIVLEDDVGRHEVQVSSNAFLYVASEPEVGQRVKRVWARSKAGLDPVPFAPALFGRPAGQPSRPAPAAPAIERKVKGGTIGWLEEREPRGESLDVLPPGGLPGHARGNAIFGRVLKPDPDRPFRVVLTVNTERPDGLPATVCVWPVTRAGASGGCQPYSDAFDRGPIVVGGSMRFGSDAFMTISGMASDDVARIDALLADGQHAEVPLEDNAFVIDLPRANLPARFVAYDDDDRVIGVTKPWSDFGAWAGPARGRARLLLRVTGPEGVAGELFVGPSTDGGECFYVRDLFGSAAPRVGMGCERPIWNGRALELGASWTPPRLVSGRVRPDVRRVRVRFADGSTTILTPTRGYVLWAVPREHIEPGHELVAFEGLDADGDVLGRQSWPPFTSSRRSSSRG
jgi:hypothetical protein